MVTNIALVIQAMQPGGAERVMATLANNMQMRSNTQVHLIILTGGEVFYELNSDVKVYRPDFDYRNYSRLIFTFKILKFLRNLLRNLRPDVTLSFGGKYNSFVLISALGLGLKTFVSERSRPGISYGKFLDTLNPIMYKRAAGIIAQTEKAKDYALQKFKHGNVRIIGNPVPKFPAQEFETKEKVILNVGRFIPSKHQEDLLDFFIQADTHEWQLWFVGDGALLDKVKAKAGNSAKSHLIKFFGNQRDVYPLYAKASIFAFTSSSEGFPNSLGEALRSGCACISYDCIAGPSDLITDGVNGYLVPMGNKAEYLEKLQVLINNESIRKAFYTQALQLIHDFNEEEITLKFLDFILDK